MNSKVKRVFANTYKRFFFNAVFSFRKKAEATKRKQLNGEHLGIRFDEKTTHDAILRM